MEQIKGRSSIEQVEEFHRVFGHPVANKVGEETLEVRQLRIKLLFEELQELATATDCERTFLELCDDKSIEILDKFGGVEYPDEERIADRTEVLDEREIQDGNNVDYIEELDALCDLQVVLDGKFLTSGHWKVKDEAFAEVHRSNMSKAAHFTFGNKSAEEWADKLAKEKGTSVHHINKNSHYVFVREDGKILKGPDFSEPNLKQFVE